MKYTITLIAAATAVAASPVRGDGTAAIDGAASDVADSTITIIEGGYGTAPDPTAVTQPGCTLARRPPRDVAVEVTVESLLPSPSPSNTKRNDGCTFGTYACLADGSGIQVCNEYGDWVLNGLCPDGTSCKDLTEEHLSRKDLDLENLDLSNVELPFCMDDKSKEKRQLSKWCPNVGQYSCDGPGAIQVCNHAHRQQRVGKCPRGSHCSNLGNLPFCVQ